MKSRVNSYLAILCITVLGAGATMLIIRIANADASRIIGGSEANYASLQRSILNQ